MSSIINIAQYYQPAPSGQSAPFSGPEAQAAKTAPPAARATTSSLNREDDALFSDSARRLAEDGNLSTYRTARAMAIRESIQDGTYETPERIEGTVRKLLDILN